MDRQVPEHPPDPQPPSGRTRSIGPNPESKSVTLLKLPIRHPPP